MKIKGKTALEISDCIRELVLCGEIAPGESLPPVRELAEILGVNRNTVSSAYQRLVKANVATTQGRLGTIVSEPRKVGEVEGLTPSSLLVDLADGNPNPDWLPNLQEVSPGCFPKTVLYGEKTVIPELLEFGRRWFTEDCPSEFELELTYGAVDAVERLANAHLVSGDKIAVEEPCFLGTINAFRLSGMQMLGVELDEHGMKPDALEHALSNGARAVLITPRAQNPTGCSLSRQRALEIKAVLSSYPNVLVIIDDHFALLSETPYFSILPSTTISWVVIRSLSKALGPDLRLAIVACDQTTAGQLRTRLAPGVNWVSHIIQRIAWSLLSSTEIEKSLHDTCIKYSTLRKGLICALQENDILTPNIQDGLNVWIPLDVDSNNVAYEMAKRGWLIRRGSAFDVQKKTHAIRVTISKLDTVKIKKIAGDLRMSIDAVRVK